MVGVTKNLSNFTEGSQGTKPLIVNSSLGNVIISNRSSTLDIYVTFILGIPSSQATSELISGTKIPPNVSLQLLEHTPLRLTSSANAPLKVAVWYSEPTANTDNLMTVTYTSS